MEFAEELVYFIASIVNNKLVPEASIGNLGSRVFVVSNDLLEVPWE